MDEDTKTPRKKHTWKPPVGRLDEVESLIAASGLSANAFITQCILEKRRSTYPLVIRQSAATMLAHQGRIASLSRELMENAQQEQPSPDLAAIHDLFLRNNQLQLECRAALFRILGRKP